MWPGLEAIAHALAYDAACLGDGQPPAARFAAITRPTLAATGAGPRRPGAASWVRALDPAADAIANSSRYVTGTLAADDGSVHHIACAPGSALRWVASAHDPAEGGVSG